MAAKQRNIIALLTTVAGVVLLLTGIFPSLRAANHSGDNEPRPAYVSFTWDELERVVYDEGVAPLVNDQHNVIIDETGSLAPFINKLMALRSGHYNGAVNIVHIGDSHVQAGFWDGRMREHFSRDFGGSSRGAVLPHRLTKTNEPRDYYIRTVNSYEGFRAISNPTRQKLSFTGTGVLFDYDYPEVEIWTREGFDAITVIRHPFAPPLVPPDSLLLDTQCVAGDTEECTTYYLSRRVDTLKLHATWLDSPLDIAPRPLYYGFVLHGGNGVVYHSIGANSAAFEHFERNTTITDGGAMQLMPDLLIVSLGTNNCYGRNYRSDNLRVVVERFFSCLAENYPGVPVLVTTPRESCQRSGRSYKPNPNIEDAAKVIRESAGRFNFACWDFYDAAGGRGIAEKWFEQKLSGRDRIHLTESGYDLMGDMMYDALVKYYNEYVAGAGIITAGHITHDFTNNNYTDPETAPYVRIAAEEIIRSAVPLI